VTDIFDPDNLEREQRAAKHRLNQQAIVDDFKEVASTHAGRRMLRRLVDRCGIYHSTYTGDALLLAHKEGQRSIGLSVLEAFEDFPDLYIKFLTEK
jgi:hypothetical protein